MIYPSYFIYFSLCLSFFTLAPSSHAQAPEILYTDIVSGPNTGGENNLGTYLSIFGKHFGSSQGNSKVFIQNQGVFTEVASYKYWGKSRYGGRSYIDQITVQLGSGISHGGSIKVVVNDLESNLDHIFNVQSGDIYFIDNTISSNSTGIIGDINSPFRYAQAVFDRSDFGPGDTIVLRGGTPWDDDGSSGRLLMIKNKGGDLNNPMMVMGYPESDPSRDIVLHRRITHYKSPGYTTVSNLAIDMQGDSAGAFGYKETTHTKLVNVRIVNAVNQAGKAGALEGIRAIHAHVLGCSFINTGGNTYNHAIYFNDRSSHIEIGWSIIDGVTSGNGIQFYHGSGQITDTLVHDTYITGVDKSGITLSTSTQGNHHIKNCEIDYNSTVTGIQITKDAKNVTIEGSTINESYTGDGHAIIIESSSSAVLLRNNTINASDAGSMINTNMSPTSYNNVWNPGPAPSWELSNNPITHTITSSHTNGGSISPSGSILLADGSSRSFFILPSSGYEIHDVLINGTSQGKLTDYTFTNVNSSNTIHVIFTSITNSSIPKKPSNLRLGEGNGDS